MIYPRLLFCCLLFLGSGLLAAPFTALCQQAEPGLSLPRSAKSDAAEVMGGDNSFSQSFNRTDCGLSYTWASAVLQQRYPTLRGQSQPVDLAINNLPCADNRVIERAYLYWVVETNQLFGMSVRLTNPDGNAQTFQGSEIGNETPGKCWGCNYSRTFRADVTSHITGNGNYRVDDLPVGATCDVGAGDTDGIALVIVYRDLTATWQGSFRLYDGIMRRNNGPSVQTMPQLSFCAAPVNAKGFVIASDFQLNTQPVWIATINGQTHGLQARFFNFEERNVTLNQSQTFSEFGVSTAADCYAFIAAGLYWQTNGCQTCGNSPSNFTVTGGTSICAGQTSPTLSFSGPANRVDTWEISTNNGASWTSANHSGTVYQPPSPPVTTWYRVKLTAVACPATYTSHTTIRVDNPPTGGTLNGGGPVCGSATPPTLTLSGHTGTIRHWEVSGDCPSFGTLTTFANPATSFTPPPATGTRCYRVRIESGACPTTLSTTATQPWESDAPLGQINGPSPVCGDTTNVLLSLTQASQPVLRWEYSDNCPAFTAPVTISHQQTTLNLPVMPAAARCYRAVMSGTHCPERFSPVFTLQVNPASLGGTIAGPATICPGGTLDPLILNGHRGNVLRWEYSDDCFASASVTTVNHTSISYTPPPITADRCWRAVVKNGDCQPVASAPHRVEVVSSQTGGALTPAQTSICQGENSPLLSLQNVQGNILRWERSTDGGQSWTSFAHTLSSFTPPQLSQTTAYRVVSQGTVCPQLISTPATITVSPASVGGLLQSNRSVCTGQTSGLLQLVGHTGAVQRWEQSIDGGQSWTTLNITTDTWTSGSLNAPIRYRVVVRSGSCSPATSSEISISVSQPTVAGEVSPNRTVCPNGNSGTLTLSGHSGAVLRWERRETPSGNWTSIANTATTLQYQNLTASTEYRAVVASGACDTLPSTLATIHVLSPTQPGTLGPAQTLCPSSALQALALTGHTGQVIHWEMSTDGGQSWSTTVHAGASWTPPRPTLTTRYRVLLRTGNCPEVYSPTVELTVAGKRPNGSLGADFAVCRGSNGGLITLSEHEGTIIRWESSADGGQSWTPHAHAGSQYPYSNLSAETWFRVLTALPLCPNEYSDTLRITMLEPAQAGTISGPAAWCVSNGNFNLNLSGHTGTILHWETAADCGFSPAQTISHAAATLNTPPVGTGRCYRAAVRGPESCPVVFSQSRFVRFDAPGRVGEISPDQSVCFGAEAYRIQLTEYDGEVIFWERSSDGFSSQIISINEAQDFHDPDSTLETCYRPVVRVGECAAQRGPVSCVDLLPPPPTGQVEGATTVCVGSSGVSLQLTGHQGTIVGWQASTDDFDQDVQNVAGANQAQHVTGAIGQRTCFRALVQSNGCTSSPSLPACVAVYDSTVAGTVMGAGRYCAISQPHNLTLSGHNGGVLFWERSSDNFSQNISTIEQTGNTLLALESETTLCYRAWVRNGDCPARASASGCVLVDVPPTAGAVTGPQELCTSDLPVVLRSEGHDGQIVFWQRRNAQGQISNIESAANEISVSQMAAGDCFRASVGRGVCPPEASEWFCPTVHAPPAPGSINGQQLVCREQAPVLALSGHAGEILIWEASTDGFQQNIIGFGAGQTQPEVPAPVQNTCYRVQVKRGTCSPLYSPAFCVTVRQPPPAGLILGAATVCKGVNAGFLEVQGGPGVPTFWEVSSDAAFTAPVQVGAGQTRVNYLNLTRTTWYRAVFPGDEVCTEVRAESVAVVVVQPKINASLTPVRCAGEANAEIRLAPSDGIPFPAPPFYAIEWLSPNLTLSPDGLSAVNLPPGAYCVKLTDALGCRADTCVTIMNPPPFTASLAVKRDLSCHESGDGFISVLAIGGVPPYVYEWHDGPGPKERDDLAAGTYVVTATDANGCSRTVGPVTLTQPPPIVVDVSYINPVRCAGGREGAIGLHVSGGAGGFQYRWSHGAAVEDVNLLTAGDYTLTITDRTGCVRVDVFNILEPAPLRIEVAELRHVSCAGGSDGRIQVEVTGGTAPYSWFWSRNNATGSLLNDAWAGSVWLYVTDAKGCTAFKSFNIEQPAPLTLTAQILKSPSCIGMSNGHARLVPAGGTAPYTFRWPDGAEAEERADLAAGAYVVTATDTKGCQQTHSFALNAPPSIQAQQLNVRHVACNGASTGSVSMYTTGGTPSYSFQWSHGPTTEDANGLSAGSYSQTITDAAGCVLVQHFVLNEPPALAVALTAYPVACTGGSSGAIATMTAGGTPPYSYRWSDGPRIAARTGLAAGNYGLEVTDANGCKAQASATVTQPQPVSIEISLWHPPTCAQEGRIAILPMGGTAPYVCRWSTGKTGSSIDTQGGQAYSVEVTDANGCVSYREFAATELPQPEIQLLDLRQPSCAGGDGRIVLATSAANAPHVWLWENGSSSPVRELLSAGVYSVTLTDARGCSAAQSFTLNASAPPEVLSVRLTTPRCAGESNGSIHVITANSEDRFQWMRDGQYITGSGYMRDLPAGFYRLWITGPDGCVTERAWWLPDPRPLTAHVRRLNPVSCFGSADGTLEAVVSGGTLPYSFQWSNGRTTSVISGLNGGVYSVAITDANGCRAAASFSLASPLPLTYSWKDNRVAGCGTEAKGFLEVKPAGGKGPYVVRWSDGGTGPRRNDLPLGAYSATITDANGCAVSTNTVNLVAPAGSPRASLVESEQPRCWDSNDGWLSVRADGGQGPYTYAWSTGDLGHFVAKLGVGIYTLTLTDARGCQDTMRQVLVTAPRMEISGTLSHPSCAGDRTGQIRATVAGGEPELLYEWSNGGRTPELTGLAAGPYTLVVTDAKGCTAVRQFVLTEPPPLALQSAVTAASCATCANGVVQLSASGGAEPYRFTMAETNETNESGRFAGLEPQSWTFRVTDANGCTLTRTVTVGASNICKAPNGVLLHTAGPTSLRAEWPPVAGATGYQVSWQKQNSTSWVTVALPATPTQHTLTNLLPATNYLLRVRTRCGETLSPWSMTANGRTASAREAFAPDAEASISLYPNPTAGRLALNWPEQAGLPLGWTAYDATGREARAGEAAFDAAGGCEIDLTGLAGGVYWLELRSAGLPPVRRAVWVME